MNEPQFGFILEYVSNIEAAKRFYIEVMGLTVKRTHPTFVQFDHFAIASDAPLGGGEPELNWLVDDAEAAYSELSRKAEVILPLTQKPFGKIFAVKDPDGQPHYLVEFSKDRPSQQVP
jgi:catechol 2,3-dioxygenase-like lactoylglutathione lyase family enzyme